MGANIVGRVAIDAVIRTDGMDQGVKQASKSLNKLESTIKSTTRSTGLQTRSSRRGTQALLEFSRGAEDATVVFGTQGFAGSIRASINNAAQLATILHPMAGVVVGLTGAVLAYISSGWDRKVDREVKALESLAGSLTRVKKLSNELLRVKLQDILRGPEKPELIPGLKESIKESQSKLDSLRGDLALKQKDIRTALETSVSAIVPHDILDAMGRVFPDPVQFITDNLKDGIEALEIRGVDPGVIDRLKKAFNDARDASAKAGKEISDTMATIEAYEDKLRAIKKVPAVAQRPPGPDIGKARDEFDKFKSSLETKMLSPLDKLNDQFRKDIETIDRFGNILHLTTKQMDALKVTAKKNLIEGSFKELERTTVTPLKKLQDELSVSSGKLSLLRRREKFLSFAKKSKSAFEKQGVGAKQAGSLQATSSILRGLRGSVKMNPVTQALKELSKVENEIFIEEQKQTKLLEQKQVILVKKLTP